MYLPDDDADTFDFMVAFIYQDRLPASPPSTNPAASDKIEKFTLQRLYPLFGLAEKLCMNELANRVMDKIQDVENELNHVPGYGSLRFAYRNTPAGSKLRMYGVLMWLYYNSTRAEEDKSSVQDDDKIVRFAKVEPEFATDYFELHCTYSVELSQAPTADAQIRNDEEGFGRCFFHTHGKGEICHLESEVDSK